MEQVVALADGADFIDALGEQALLAGAQVGQLPSDGCEQGLVLEYLGGEILGWRGGGG